MRRTVICITSTPRGAEIVDGVERLDLADVVVLGADGPWADAAGAAVVVLDAVSDAACSAVAARCSAAVVVVATDAAVADTERVLAQTKLPRSHVFGTAGGAPAAVAIVEAILRERTTPLDVAVLCRGEGDARGVQLRPALVGAAGIQEIL
jgi:hypothetical protein